MSCGNCCFGHHCRGVDFAFRSRLASPGFLNRLDFPWLSTVICASLWLCGGCHVPLDLAASSPPLIRAPSWVLVQFPDVAPWAVESSEQARCQVWEAAGCLFSALVQRSIAPGAGRGSQCPGCPSPSQHGTRPAGRGIPAGPLLGHQPSPFLISFPVLLFFSPLSFIYLFVSLVIVIIFNFIYFFY